MKLLIADDQPEFVQSITPHLKKARFDVEHVLSADAAIERLKSVAFDLVLTDLQMPPGNWGGLDLIRSAREIDAVVPVVVVSGKGSLAECVKAVRFGANEYIQKECFSDEFAAWAGRFYSEPFALLELPSLIGYLYRAYVEEHSPYVKARRLVDAFEASVRLVACLLLAELSACRRLSMSDILHTMSLERPTLGVYVARLFELLKGEAPGQFSAALASSDIVRSRRQFDDLVACRNDKLGHSATLSAAQASDVVRKQHPNLVRVLNALAPVRRFELIRADSLQYDGSRYVTAGQLLKGVDLHVYTATRNLASPATSGHVILTIADRIVADCHTLVDIVATDSSVVYSYELFDAFDVPRFRYWTVPRLEI